MRKNSEIEKIKLLASMYSNIGVALFSGAGLSLLLQATEKPIYDFSVAIFTFLGLFLLAIFARHCALKELEKLDNIPE